MYSTKHILIFTVFLVFTLLAIQPTVLAHDASSNFQDEQKSLRLLEKNQSPEKRLLGLLSQQPEGGEPQISSQDLTLFVTLLVAIGGWAFATYQMSRTRKDAQLSRLEEHLLRSLEFFSGGTQRRSIGIAVVKAHWEQFPQFRPTWVSLFISQAIYLLTASKQHDKKHELQNLQDIMKILLESISDIGPEDKSDLKDAIKNNRTNVKDKNKDGIKIVTPEDLNKWEKSFGESPHKKPM